MAKELMLQHTLNENYPYIYYILYSILYKAMIILMHFEGQTMPKENKKKR